ncbi:hypothetical protein [Streptomyces litchfieldiae]|uniref:Uncharacterized protein n=1 Tax=Streptomyces litchfieldiae TaxID=3075543 RepID=A0ABU2MRF5_9ACTN|nr:hypothetical protein [Streptomyces sp. DSM 44938]MDT0344208.1 hypothetical protein [Streptomyces sp. DSM 44938]
MRRTAAVLLSLCGLLSAMTLTTTAASASSSGAGESPAAAGWRVVDTELLNELLVEDGLAPLDESADEPQEVPYAIESVRNGLVVASEQRLAEPYTGLLRARSATWSGSWELFDIYWDDTRGTVSLRSNANGLYVAAERNYTGAASGVLRARSESIGGWERFVLWYDETTGRFSFESRAIGLFVATELNATGTLQNALRARSDWINGSWEEFNLY